MPKNDNSLIINGDIPIDIGTVWMTVNDYSKCKMRFALFKTNHSEPQMRFALFWWKNSNSWS